MEDFSKKGDRGVAPDSRFVRDTYDSLLNSLPGTYSAYRWEQTPVSRFHFRQSRRALVAALAHVPVSLNRALEIGGGGGVWTPWLAERARTLDFLDISESMLKEARTTLVRFPHISYIHADFLEWEPEGGAYDLVASFRNIEYMNDKAGVVARFAKALTPGGTLLLSTKNPSYDWKGYFKNKTLHGGQMSVRSLTALLKENGFTVVRVYPAIIGKKIGYAPFRLLWNGLHAAMVRLPNILLPVFVWKYIAESVIFVARKS